MRKAFIFFAFIICFSNAYSQQIVTDFIRFSPDSIFIKNKNLIGITGDYQFNSNSITNTFFKEFLNNSYIDNSLKDQVSERLKSVNRYGYQVNGTLFVQAAKDSSFAWLAGLSLRQMNYTQFSRDMFNLFFRGNAMFAGNTAHLDPLKFGSFDYQTISLGIKNATTNKKLTWWAGLSGVRGGNFRLIKAKRALFYTEPDGAYLEADANFQTSFSPGKPSLIGESNGYGASIFFGADLHLKKSVLGLSVSDLGFIRYNDLKTFQGNSVFRFEGKEIQNILSFSDTLFKSYNADSLAKDVGIKKSTTKKTFLIPAIIKLNYVNYSSEKFYFITGLEYILNAAYRPRLSIRPVYSIGKKLFLHAELATGGYGKADFEIGMTALCTNKIAVYLSLFAAEYLAAPSKTSGNGLSFSVVKSF